nr:ATP-dependent RNA helicase [Ipomoea batatas]
MIADILTACLTNLPHLIATKCICNAIEKREKSVRDAAIILGETEDILKCFEKRKLSNMGPRQPLCIDEWRQWMQRHAPTISTSATSNGGTSSDDESNQRRQQADRRSRPVRASSATWLFAPRPKQNQRQALRAVRVVVCSRSTQTTTLESAKQPATFTSLPSFSCLRQRRLSWAKQDGLRDILCIVSGLGPIGAYSGSRAQCSPQTNLVPEASDLKGPALGPQRRPSKVDF